MKELHIDYETFSKTDIKSRGAYKYSECSSTEVLMLGWALDDEEPQLWINSKGWPGEPEDLEPPYIVSPDIPYELMEHLEDPEVLVWAHNVGFEKAISDNVLLRDYPFLDLIDSGRYRCTAALSRSLALHGDLEGAAIDLELQEKKDPEGKRLIRKFSLPRKPTKNDDRTRLYGWMEDCKEDFIKFCDYCIQDVKTERAIHSRLKRYEFKDEELEIFKLDTAMNSLGVPIDTHAVRKGLALVGEYSKIETEKFREMSGGINPTQRDKAMMAINDLMPEGIERLENLQAGAIDAWLKAYPHLEGQQCFDMLKIRRSLGRSSTKKLQAMLNTAGKGDRVRGSLLFHGATTGRWAGRLIQPQNLPRPVIKNTLEALDATLTMDLEDVEFLYGDPMAVVSSVIRHYIAAPKGQDLMVADYSAIEARILCWVAGEKDAVRMFQREVDARREFQDGKISGEEYKEIKRLSDLYIDMAALVYDKPSHLITDGERALGKAIILGCGYQMWHTTFYETCLAWGMKIDPKLAERSVKVYRSKYPKIAALWPSMEKAAIQAVLKPGEVYPCAKFKFLVDDGFMFMRLPSGRKLAYPRPEIKMVSKYGKKVPQLNFYGKGDSTVFWGHKSTYGGKLTENSIQAVARDVMGNGMVQANQAGYNVFTSIHDEAPAIVKEGWGSVKEYERLLCKQPAWADGIPLAAEGYRAKRYRK